MSRRALNLVFNADLGSSALVGPALRGIAEAVGFERARAAEVALCAQEAAVNAAEHAFAGQPEGVVTVLVAFDEGLLEVSVHDKGQPMPPGLLDAARVTEPDPLADRGRGLFMITRLTETVSYCPGAEKNVLEMTFRLSPAAE
ncbi:MAG: ATP-binding protein [Holophagales bacterium]|nr:ATP-binding protein [Holophagales bacterium]MBK9967081.1 ATP-binding protein [Holophagales bacterium]